MRAYLKYLFGLLFFWLLLFALQRGVFLLYNNVYLENVPATEIALSWWFSLRMDLATSAFLISIPLLLQITALFFRKKIFSRLTNIIVIALIIIVLFIGIIDTALYSNWGSKINAKAISYALFPSETARATSAVPVWLFVLIYLAETALAVFIYYRFLRARRLEKKPRLIYSIVIPLLLLAITPILFRGGFQKYPLGKNSVYYSRHMVLNNAALNGPWNFINVISTARSEKKPYEYTSAEEAEQLFLKYFGQQNQKNGMPLFLQSRPNIIIILMESVSAGNLRYYGGQEDIMPGLDSLMGEGLAFNRCYASGFRTEQGLIAILSGFPAQPTSTISREFGKFEKLPSLPKMLSDSGYHCNYYYSGDLEFANTSAFLNASSFTKILDKDARPWLKTTQWGALDEELFACHLKEADQDARPFFTIIMTSTNHEAFDGPVPQKFGTSNELQRYKNTSAYTDSCLLAYIKGAEKSSWWNETIIIITSDHAHYWPGNRQKNEPERHHVPLLITGGALNPALRGYQIDAAVSQTDFPALILNALNEDASMFKFSRNPLDTNISHTAFYTFDNGFGLINDTAWLVYDHDLGKVLLKGPGSDEQENGNLLNAGKAYLQVMYRKYLE